MALVIRRNSMNRLRCVERNVELQAGCTDSRDQGVDATPPVPISTDFL